VRAKPSAYAGSVVTLIYAQKLEDCILVYSDTYSEVPMTQQRTNPFVDPLIKISMPINGVVVAYAGNSARAEAALQADEALSNSALLERLQVQSESDEVEFVVASQADLSLKKVSSAGVVEVQAAFLGSARGSEMLQAAIHSEMRPQGTFLGVIAGIDFVSRASQERLGRV